MSDKKALELRLDWGGVCIDVAKSVAIVCEAPLLTIVTEREWVIDGEGVPVEPFSSRPPTSKNETFFLGLAPVAVDGEGDGNGKLCIDRWPGLISPSLPSTASSPGVSTRRSLSAKSEPELGNTTGAGRAGPGLS
jgi:hypothetical protein